MSTEVSKLSQGDLIKLGTQVQKADDKFSTSIWKFPAALRTTLNIELNTYSKLVTKQNFSVGEKEMLTQSKQTHFAKTLIDVLRRVIHYIKATASDPKNVLDGYGYDSGDFPRKDGEIVALGRSMVNGDNGSLGEPYALPPDLKTQLTLAVTQGETLLASQQLASGEQQETTQTQNESRVRLERIIAQCREWLYARVPQARHDEILEHYGFKPLAERVMHTKLGSPKNLQYDPATRTFSWESIEDATKYRLAMEGAAHEIYIGAELSFVYSFTGEHRFRVSAYNDELLWGRWSRWITVSA